MTNQDTQSNRKHLNQELLIQAVSTTKSLKKKVNKINKKERAETIKKKATKTKLIKSRKSGKKIFLWSLFFLALSFPFPDLFVISALSIVSGIISLGMWKGDPDYRQDSSSSRSSSYESRRSPFGDLVNNPAYSSFSCNIYNRR
jgi:hypothetical protein